MTLAWDGQASRIADTLPLAAVAVVPRQRTSTAAARSTLPVVVPHEDAAATAGRAALLGASVALGDPELFAHALADRLHEPHRPSQVLDAVRYELPTGARGATLSGSGPTVIVWASETESCQLELRSRFPDHDVLVLEVAKRGAL